MSQQPKKQASITAQQHDDNCKNQKQTVELEQVKKCEDKLNHISEAESNKDINTSMKEKKIEEKKEVACPVCYKASDYYNYGDHWSDHSDGF